MTGIYKLAGLIISISSLYKEVHIMCAAYRADPEDGAPVFEVSTAKADVEREREKQAREDAFEGLPVQEYSDEYLETLAVYRKIAEKLPFFNCFLFHGSVVAVNGKGYLFTAKSGTGKSTHTRLWRELLGEAAFMINDDKPFLCVKEGETLVYGTPWDGKHHLSRNASVPLKAVCLLQRSEENWIREITKTEALPMLLQQAYRPADPMSLSLTLQLIDSLSNKFYSLGCNTDISAAQLAWQTMQ